MDDLPRLVNALITLWLAAFPLMGSPGPATLSLAGIGVSYGFRKGTPYLAGIIAGTTGVLLMIATGVTALILAQPALVAVLTAIGGAYIVYLAWKIATAPVGQAPVERDRVPAFVPGLLLAIANPKAFAAIGAVYSSQTLVPDRLVTDTIAKLAALVVVIVIVNTMWLTFGATFSRLLTHPTVGRVTNATFAFMLLASVAFAFLGS